MKLFLALLVLAITPVLTTARPAAASNDESRLVARPASSQTFQG